MSKYALLCIGGPQKGQWYTRRGYIVRFTRVRAGLMLNRLNKDATEWVATKYRQWIESHKPPEP